MRTREIMKRDVRTCSPEDPVSMVARMMRDEGIGFVPVCDESRRVLGVLTDRDITVRVVAEGWSPHTVAREVMSREIFTCRADGNFDDARRVMAEHKVSRVLCVDADGSLEGVISLSDVTEHSDEAEAAGTMRAVSERETSP
jgi:CBS domain-containing protein